ncbi:MAG: ATP-dependent 6-phosphofructokinase [Desulfovibrionaceae bacterium]|nr:ATP-dependent 6-phosphofructokinase [Desulfovibrionaceae bacterium]
MTITRVAVASLGAKTIDSPICSGKIADDARIELSLGPNIFSDLTDYHSYSFELGGAREKIYFDPDASRCAIVTCGGLCPGLNDIIQSLVWTACHNYGVRSVIGIRHGLQGFIPDNGLEPMELDPGKVFQIHELGGSILGTSRGPQPTDVIVDRLERLNINMLFIIGGDGTMHAAQDIYHEITRRGRAISVTGIPKTVDNDINFIPKSFGFETAVEKASEAIRCAYIEATSVLNGVGLVKLMGRESGFIAANASLAIREADFVLVPEVPFTMEGKHGLLQALENRLIQNRHAVIVVAEGAGQDLFQTTNKCDASGNRKLEDIAAFMLARFKTYFAERGIPYYPKYFDPGYLIRATPANTYDRQYCGNLGQNAVHAAFSGRTGMVVARIMDKIVHVPLELVTARRRVINPHSDLWRAVMEMTGQGDLNDRESCPGTV